MDINVRVTFANGTVFETYWDANEMTLYRVNLMIGNEFEIHYSKE